MNVLMLHDIREFDEGFFPERYKLPSFLVPRQFFNILRNIEAKGGSFISLDDEFNLNLDTLHRSKTLLTFDDGLKDHLFIARELAKKKIKGCFFVPSGPILERSIIDSHKIQFVLASEALDVLVSYIKESHVKSACQFNINLDEYFMSRWRNNVWKKEMIFVTRVLREHPDKIWRRQLLDDLFLKYVTSDTISFAAEFYLSYEDVEEIKSFGHIIGGHGHYSFDLRYEESVNVESELLSMSNFLLKINQNVKLYAYANGGYTDFVLKELVGLGFDFGFTTEHRAIVDLERPFELPRIDGTKTNLIFD